MISIVLIEPENSGNIGAVARVMANFDLKDLVIINPKCDVICEESRRRAKHAQKILQKANITDLRCLKGFDLLVGTTSKIGTDYNIPRSPVLASELASKVGGRRKVAILFGREGIGLTNEEIGMCDFVVTIPSSEKYPALNLSHSCAIIFYELFRAKGEDRLKERFPIASARDKEQINKFLSSILNKMEFATKDKRETQFTVWKRVIGKSSLTKREAFAIMGFLRKLKP